MARTRLSLGEDYFDLRLAQFVYIHKHPSRSYSDRAKFKRLLEAVEFRAPALRFAGLFICSRNASENAPGCLKYGTITRHDVPLEIDVLASGADFIGFERLWRTPRTY